MSGLVNIRGSFIKSYDADRAYNVKQLITKASNYHWNKGYMIAPSGWEVLPEGKENAIPVCKQGITDPSCANIDVLVPDYFLTLPQDTAEPNPLYSGYMIYQEAGRTMFFASHDGKDKTPSYGISVIASDLVTTEAGGTDDFSIILNTKPSANVDIAISSDNTDEGTVSSSSITFTSVDWNIAQVITVTGVNDAEVDDDKSYNIIIAAAVSEDANYNGLDPADVSVINMDDDVSGPPPGVTVGSISGDTTEAGAGTATFTIVLDSDPTGDVVIDLASLTPTEGLVTSPTQLTFNSGNWSVNKIVTVTGQDEEIDDGDQEYIVTVEMNIGLTTATEYTGIDPSDVVITNIDDDVEQSMTQWVQETGEWSTRWGFGSVVYNGKMWMLGGAHQMYTRKNDVWSSVDGVTWSQVTAAAPWGIRNDHEAIVYNGKIWVMGGYGNGISYNDVWSSIDGINWTQETAAAPWTIRGNFGATVFDGKMWIAGGHHLNAYQNDVWSSVDGINWIQETGSANWSDRTGLRLLTHNGKMWVSGGQYWDGATVYLYNDVWSSTDGINWTQETVAAGWAKRSNHTTISYNGKMYVMGGDILPNGSGVADVWSSTDGVTWSEVTSNADWSARLGHSSVVFNNGSGDKAWVLGGRNDVFSFNDVWYSSAPAPPGITVTPTSGLITYEDQGQADATFTVNLNSLPTDTVTIPTITSTDMGEGTVSPSSLTFTTSNWEEPQTVTVSGVDDGDSDGNIVYNINMSNVISADDNYNGLTPDSVAVTNMDDEAPILPYMYASIPRPIDKDQSGWYAVTVFNPGGSSVNVTAIHFVQDDVGQQMFSSVTTAGYPTSGWSVDGGNSQFSWIGSQDVAANSAKEFFVKIKSNKKNHISLMNVEAIIDSVSYTHNIYTTQESSANAAFASLWIDDNATISDQEYVFRGGAQSELDWYTVVLAETSNRASIATDGTLTIDIPSGFTDVSCVGGTGWNTAITCTNSQIVVTNSSTVKNAQIAFSFQARPPAAASTELYLLHATFVGSDGSYSVAPHVNAAIEVTP